MNLNPRDHKLPFARRDGGIKNTEEANAWRQPNVEKTREK